MNKLISLTVSSLIDDKLRENLIKTRDVLNEWSTFNPNPSLLSLNDLKNLVALYEIKKTISENFFEKPSRINDLTIKELAEILEERDLL